jgi:biofilm PGA synthesis lipoprotein PgaB
MRPFRPLLLVALALTLAGGVARSQPGVPPRPSRPTAPRGPLISILCYHDLSTDTKRLETVSPEFLRAQIRSCKAAGWTFLSLSELLAHRGDPEHLPPRTLVLTFDDGYRSFIEQALPILKEENVKATLAGVTSFVDNPPADVPPIMTWDQIREAERSGLVEIASHTHDLHRYETDNPWRDTAPSVSARRWRAAESRYETRDEYRERVAADLRESQRILTERLGHPVTTLVWPYGDHNRMARALAAEAGYPVSLELGWREVTAADLESGCLPRVMVDRTFDFSPREPLWIRQPVGAVRAAQVDIDELYDPDATVFRRRVDQMIARVRGAGATHVILQACPDLEGDGMMRETWFMNHQAPVRADVWSMIAHKLIHARLKVWVRAPTMNLAWVWERHPEWRIPWDQGRVPNEPKPWYYRLSPNLPEARQAAVDFYTDLAVYLPIEGVLFDDDAYMLQGESLNGSKRSTPEQKAEAIRGLHEEIRAAVRAWRPRCRFARNLYAPVVERNGIHPGFAQDYAQCLRDYDLTVVMAYVHMEGHAKDAARWIASLTRRAQQRWTPPPGEAGQPAPVVIKLQAYDWNTERWVPEKELQSLAWEAHRAGAVLLGIYPFSFEAGEIPARVLEGVPPEGVAVKDSSR